ncbi:cupin domain-containing protein [Shumkonia mesophila]|uniref:hypothetical protein n=1 Tax=Shumkonia mesophila TaxID=2838854 RepID=UPI0029349C26|nr:hypothetical protein [Shumkonia mesophila]
MSDNNELVRQRSVVEFDQAKPERRQSTDHWYARGQNFVVEWVDGRSDGATFQVTTAEEAFLLLPSAGATVKGAAGAVTAGSRTVCILPPGEFQVILDKAEPCACLYSDPAKLTMPGIINASAYNPPDPRVAPVTPKFKRVDRSTTVKVIEIDKITTQGKNSAMKVLQNATMSMSWVNREGPRDRTSLSPHVHQDFEQGSLAIFGRFIHHLRVDWGKNADLWREDEHVQVPDRSLLVVPPGLIHTTQGNGEGAHLLIDIFSPARVDFIAKGFVANAADYVAE